MEDLSRPSMVAIMGRMNATPSPIEINETTDALDDDLSDVEQDLDRLAALDPAETPELARQINDRLAEALDATDGQST